MTTESAVLSKPAGNTKPRDRRLGLQALLLAVVVPGLLAGCATVRPPVANMEGQAWSGRLSLQIDEDPPRHAGAAFELAGNPSVGTLQLLSPLGQIVASARWDGNGAWLQQGNHEQPYPDADSLISSATGAPLPLATLFAWLRGEAAPLEGWAVDLSRHADGRLTARRTHPLPAVQLRLVFQ